MIGMLMLVAGAVPTASAHDFQCLVLATKAERIVDDADHWPIAMLGNFYLGRLTVRDAKRDWAFDAAWASNQADGPGEMDVIKECAHFLERETFRGAAHK